MHKLIAFGLTALFAANVAFAAPANAPAAPAAAAPAKDAKAAPAPAKAAEPQKAADAAKPAKPDTAAPASDCEAKAMGKDGKPLHGAAKGAFMKKCEKDMHAGMPAQNGMAKPHVMPKPAVMPMRGDKAACEMKAVSKDGKPLAGAAKATFMKKCMMADAKPK